MASTYAELYYHFIWSTKEREPFITDVVEPHLFRYIRTKCAEMKVQVHALNGMPDHVHLACSLPPSLSPADAMEKVKGASAHFVNRLAPGDLRLYWQDGYGVLTFTRRELPRVVAYIDGQKQHHASGQLSEKMERCGE